MNRIKIREIVRKLKNAKGLKKKKTKGAFGKSPEYIMDDKRKKAFKKNSKLSKKVVSVETKELKDIEFNGIGIHLKKETEVVENKEVTKEKTQHVETKDVRVTPEKLKTELEGQPIENKEVETKSDQNKGEVK